MQQIISAIQVDDLLKQGGQLLDVRTHSEFMQDAVKGAINFPLQQIEQNSSQLDRQKPIIVYCRTGGRSAMAIQILIKAGFENVHNLGSLSNYNRG